MPSLRICLRSIRLEKPGSSLDMDFEPNGSSRSRKAMNRLLLTLVILSTLILMFTLHDSTARSVFWRFSNASDHQDRNRSSKVLRFNEDGKFRISIFEDLHFGEAEDTLWGPLQDLKSQIVMKDVLAVGRPDLVVLNGDLITGENTFRENSTAYLDQLVSPLVDAKVYWASTYGNHDRDYNLSASDLFEVEQRFAMSLTQDMLRGDADEVGITNYYLPIYPTEHMHSSETPAAILYFLDSRGGKKYQVPPPNEGLPSLIHSDVLRWLEGVSDQFYCQYKKVIPSIAFFHIPLSAMFDHQRSLTGIDGNREPGLNDDNPLDAQHFDSAVMTTLANIDGLVATFSGHDHGNDWCMRWNRTAFLGQERRSRSSLADSVPYMFHCFGRRSGYGGYGDWIRGSRQLSLDINSLQRGELDTWISLEDGTISGQVSLNATYGSDRYAPVERK